jgi:hypothetical protein
VTAPSRPGLRRRIDRRLLRIQGRLDSDSADRVLPWVYAFIVFLTFALLAGARIRSLEGGSGLAPWTQAAWRRAHGGAGTPMTGADPAAATWSFVSEGLLQISRVIPVETVLVLAQALALGLAVIPLWRLARREAHLRVGASTVVVVAFALAPTLQRAGLGTFHPELLAVPALVAAYDRFCRDQWFRFALLVAFAVLCRADLGVTVAALGVLLMVQRRRWQGIATILFGLGWTTLAYLAIDPMMPDEALTPAGEFVARSRLPLAVVPDLLLHPWDSLVDLVAEPSVLFIVVVLAPLLFLPLMAPRKVVLAVPSLLLAMLADQAVQRVAGQGVLDLSPAAAHIGPTMAFVFIALVFALERIGEPSVTRVNVDHRVLMALLAGVFLLFLTESPSSPYQQPWEWGGRDALDGARLDAAELAGDDDRVGASPQVSALVADRAVVVEVPPHPASLDAERVARVGTSVDLVILDTSVEEDIDGLEVWNVTERDRVVAAFGDYGFELAYDVQDVLVLVKE